MNRIVGGLEGRRWTGAGRRVAWLGAMLAVGAALAGSPVAARAQAPTVTSVTPANGATGVAVDGTLAFTFSQAMDDSVSAIPTVGGFLVGNLVFTPDVFSDFDFSWSEDARTLNCAVNGELPANTLISWKLNPAGSFLPFTSATGTPAASASGSFTTGAAGGGGGEETPPTLVSSNPAKGATGVSVTSTVTFVFDMPMTPNPMVGGNPPFLQGAVAWTGAGLDATKFTYTWSADSKSLSCKYSGELPGNTLVGWTLNPAGAMLQLTSDEPEVPLATTTGSFTTGTGSGTGGGDEECNQGEPPADWGSYGLSKSAQYEQTSAADPALVTDSPPNVGAIVMAPLTEAALTAGSLTLPSGTRKDITKMPFGNGLMLTEEFATVAALDAAYPAGSYTLRFQQTGQAERVVAMSVPAANPPTPKVGNYDAAQNVDPAANFTLTWGPFAGAVAGTDHVSLVLTETSGFPPSSHVVFSAPNPCIPRDLAVTATQIVIPAGTLSGSKIYDADLTFSRVFLNASNSIPKMYGYGSITRSTHFKVATKGATTPPAAARFTAYRLLPDGKPELTLTGTAGRVYTIQRATAPTGATWTVAGSATMGANGQAVYVDAAPGAFPVYYRALGQ